MTFLGDFHFIRPGWLALAPIVLAIWWLARRSQDPLRGWRAVMAPELLQALTLGKSNRNQWRGLLLAAAWLLAVVSVAGPTWRPEPSPFSDDPVPVMLILKANETMNQSDLMPSRMERARLKVEDFASERKGQPLGLVTYAGTAHLILPPTRDTSVVASMAMEVSPDIMPKQGDDLASALKIGSLALGDARGSLVVFTDTAPEGVNNALAEFREQSSLPVYFLAVARADTPEYDAIQRAASTLGADTVLMTPDSQDVSSLARSAGKAPVAVGVSGEGTRWAEAGWWLVPFLAMFSLISFRRVRNEKLMEVSE